MSERKRKIGILMSNLPKEGKLSCSFMVDGFPSAVLKNSAIPDLINTFSYNRFFIIRVFYHQHIFVLFEVNFLIFLTLSLQRICFRFFLSLSIFHRYFGHCH